MNANILSPPSPAVLIRALKHATKSGFRLDLANVAIGTGEVVAVIGGNGSGKSTLLEMLLGLRDCALIDVDLLGNPLRTIVRQPELRREIGAQLQRSAFPRELRIREIVDLHLTLYGRQDAIFHEGFNIPEIADRTIGQLSRGQGMRLRLFLACAHRPKLLFLDEPTTGLDARYARDFLDLFHDELTAPDRTIVMVSHNPHEIRLCHRALWMTHGRIADSGPLDSLLLRHVNTHKVEVEFANARDADVFLNTVRADDRILIHQPSSCTARLYSDRPQQDRIIEEARRAGAIHLLSALSDLSDLVMQQGGR
jgi:ABC-2 type transport system ATP-binding protein